MDELYPIVKKAKTSCGYVLKEEERFLNLYYCPICGKRLSGRKVDNNDYHLKFNNKKLNPIHCEKCGSLIHPLPLIESNT